MNANKQIVYFKLIFSVYTVNYTYFGLQASPAAVDMLQFEMSVMFIPYFMIDSWLQGSSPLRDLPIIINRSHAFRWDRRSMHCLTNVEVFLGFFCAKHAPADTPSTPSKARVSGQDST